MERGRTWRVSVGAPGCCRDTGNRGGREQWAARWTGKMDAWSVEDLEDEMARRGEP